MSLADVFIVSPGGQNLPPALTFRTEANSTVINAGDPVNVGGTGTNYAVLITDADPVPANVKFIGVAATTSNSTASLDGTVDVYLALPGVVFGCKAKTFSTFDTDAELLAVLNDQVPFDVTSSVVTIDVAASSPSGAFGLKIVGGDVVNGIVYFTVAPACLWTNKVS